MSEYKENQEKTINGVGQVSDEALVFAAQKEDKQAMESLLLRYVGLVRSIARGYFLVGGDTEDLIQEGMIGLYNAISDYKLGDTAFKTFAKLCITRRILDAVKASGRQKNRPLNNYVSLFEEEVDVPMEEDPLSQMIHREDGEELFRKMSEVLSDLEFRIMMMYMKGMSTAEICKITKRNEKSVDNALQRSKKKLQKAFEY